MKCSSIIAHIVTAIIITAIVLVVYTTVRQIHRSPANGSQLQVARALSAVLSKGKSIDQMLPACTINITQSLDVFIGLFNKNGKPLHWAGFLNSSLPQPPQNIFEFTNTFNEDALTWQTQSNVRMAMVFERINAVGEGFVVEGRSLKETEIGEGTSTNMIGIVCSACMEILLLHLLLRVYLRKKLFQ